MAGARLAHKAKSARGRLGGFIVSDSASDSGVSDSGPDSGPEGEEAAGTPGGFDWASGNVQDLIRALVQAEGYAAWPMELWTPCNLPCTFDLGTYNNQHLHTAGQRPEMLKIFSCANCLHEAHAQV